MTQTTVRRGRPPGTTPRDLELIAMRLFTERGYDATTVEDIAAEAGVSSRTFFRYFDSKSTVLWHQFDSEVAALRRAFDAVDPATPLMAAIRTVVVSVNRYTAGDAVELRTRINLIATVPALQASAAPHYDAWENEVIAFAARRLDLAPNSLPPLAIGRATLAVCRAAFELWVQRADTDLVIYLDEALSLMADGFIR
jgi:mycofactocin system transcriptional regulator